MTERYRVVSYSSSGFEMNQNYLGFFLSLQIIFLFLVTLEFGEFLGCD